MNIENMRIWRDFLISNDLPFEMQFYRCNPGEAKPLPITKDEVDAGPQSCGTAGCAIGWAPFVIPALSNEFDMCGRDSSKLLNVSQYVERAFELPSHSIRYEFITDMTWSKIDNTRLGAAFRINCVIRNTYKKYDGATGFGFVAEKLSKETVQRYLRDRDEWVASLGETA